MKQNKSIKIIISLAMCLCVAVLGLVAAMSFTLWNESWMMHSMKKSGYFEDAAHRTKADCGLVIAQAGVLGNFVEKFISDEMIQEDIVLATDALFRNISSPTSSHFGKLAVEIEDTIYQETGTILGESEKQNNIAVQFQTEQQYAESVRPPLQTIVSILMQYKKIGIFLAIASLVVIVGATVVLFGLSKTIQQWIQTIGSTVMASSVTMFLMAIVSMACRYQKWMPQTNLEYSLFVQWFGGVPLGLCMVGVILLIFSVVIFMIGLKPEKRGV